MYKLTRILIKIQIVFLVENERLIVKLIWKCKELKIVKQKNDVGELLPPDCKIYYKYTAIKTV